MPHDFAKVESVSNDYLHRIDTMNGQLLDAYAESRKLNSEIKKMVNSNADDMKGMIDRVFRLIDIHTVEIKILPPKN